MFQIVIKLNELGALQEGENIFRFEKGQYVISITKNDDNLSWSGNVPDMVMYLSKLYTHKTKVNTTAAAPAHEAESH